MKTATELTPLMATHPGEILLDEIEAIELSQVDFAKQLGMPRSQLNEIIKGKRNINADLALLLEKVLGIDVEYWMEAQKNYDIDKARIEAKNQNRMEAIEQWKVVKSLVADKFLRKQKVISGDPVIDLPIIFNIYDVNSIDQLASLKVQPEFARFRKSDNLANDPTNIIAWVKLVRFEAKKVMVDKFDYSQKDNLLMELRAIITENKDTIKRTQVKLSEYGIKLIYQAKGDKSPIDGVSFWSEGNPAIGMTLRHSRIDNFAFTLFHELGHIYKHLVNNTQSEFIDLINSKESEEYKKSKEEFEANDFAGESLIGKKSWEEFLQRAPKFTDFLIKAFAEEIELHPAIIRGRLCHQFSSLYKVKTSIDYKIY